MLPRSILFSTLTLLAAASTTYAQGTLVVVNQKEHALEFVNPATGDVIAKTTVGVNGHEVAISPDGKLAYVPIYSSVGVGKPGTDGQTIDIVNIANAKISTSFDLHKPVRPHRAIFGPDGLLYVSAELDQAIYGVDPKSGTIVAKLPTGADQSHMFYFTPDGSRAYTANVGSGSVSVIDVKSRKLITIIPLSKRVQRMVVSLDGRRVFTSDWDQPRIAVIDTKTNKLDHWQPTGGMPYVTEPTPDGKFLLIGEHDGERGLMEVLDLTTNTIVRQFHLPSLPNAFLIHDNIAYMSCPGDGNIARLKISSDPPATWLLQQSLQLTHGVDGMGWSPIITKP